MLITSIFGSYPEREAAQIKLDLNAYFQPSMPNTEFKRMAFINNVWIKLYFEYSDGTDLSKTKYVRIDKAKLVERWKSDMLNLICANDNFRYELEAGRKIEVDLKDGDSLPKAQILANMAISKHRC